MKPRELETYLFQPNFSLHSHVVPKSTIMPEKPTAQNFANFHITTLSVMFYNFKWLAVCGSVDEVVQAYNNWSVRDVLDNGVTTQTSSSRYDHVRVNGTFYRGKIAVAMQIGGIKLNRKFRMIKHEVCFVRVEQRKVKI